MKVIQESVRGLTSTVCGFGSAVLRLHRQRVAAVLVRLEERRIQLPVLALPVVRLAREI
jgi:hypothetical protein